MASDLPGMRITVRVRTGVSRPFVGGRYGEDALVVAVSARPVDGAANRAVTAAVATAFGVPARDVEVVAGHKSRTKIVFVVGAPDVLASRLADLLGS